MNENITDSVIFVVFGHRGSWSDYSYWSVCGYTLESDAKHHVSLANKWCRSIKYPDNPTSEEARIFYTNDVKNPYDDSYQTTNDNWSETEYIVEKLDLHTYFKLNR